MCQKDLLSQISVLLQNCYGIKFLETEFKFSSPSQSKTKNLAVVYAPNGTMKTSFYRTFDKYSKGQQDQVLDRIHCQNPVKIQILDAKGNPVPGEVIVVADGGISENHKQSSTHMLASRDLKRNYDEIIATLEDRKKKLIANLKRLTNSTDCEAEFVNSFKTQDGDSFYICLSRLKKEISVSKQRKYDFKYNSVFDKTGKVKDFVEANMSQLQKYFENYNSLLTQSSFFHCGSGVSFGTYQASVLANNMKDGAFFSASHKIKLRNGVEISSSESLQQTIQAEYDSIFTNEELQKTFNEITKKLDANAQLREFKTVIERDNSIVPLLHKYEELRKSFWISSLQDPSIKEDVLDLINLFYEKKSDIDKILSDAEKQLDKWRNVLTIFKNRFHVPFSVSVNNVHDVIFNQKTAVLTFSYEDSQKEVSFEREDEMLDILSKGEERAFAILHLIFEIEARKLENESTLFVFDDIAESFDYQNKYAIIEYLFEIEKSGLFKSIVLTHNFDFYRSLCSRLSLGADNAFMAIKRKDGDIVLVRGQYRRNLLDYFLSFIGKDMEPNSADLFSKETQLFICLIPFVRNLIEYTHTDLKNNEDYMLLTNVLHFCTKGQDITALECKKLYERVLVGRSIKVSEDIGREKIWNLIASIVLGIVKDSLKNEQLDIENKIVMAMYLRLRIEKYMKMKLQVVKSTESFDLSMITGDLFQEFESTLKDSDDVSPQVFEVIRKVLLMTPETIHLNSFMYEPILDMSSYDLALKCIETDRCLGEESRLQNEPLASLIVN